MQYAKSFPYKIRVSSYELTKKPGKKDNPLLVTLPSQAEEDITGD